MDTITEIYVLVSAIFISIWFARRVPIWMKRMYARSVAKNGYKPNNAIQYCYEVFFEGA